MTVNGSGGKFDKMMRRGDMRKGAFPFEGPEHDDILRTLRKHSPEIAATVEKLDQTFAALLAKLDRIEAAHEAIRLAPPTLLPPRGPNPDEVLRSMATMAPDQRAALLNKLKQ